MNENYNAKAFNAGCKLEVAADKYEARVKRAMRATSHKLYRMSTHLINNDLAAARQIWHRNKPIRIYVPASVQRILFPEDYRK